MKKKEKTAVSAAVPEFSENTQQDDLQKQVDDVMRKYDKESNTRIWEGPFKLVNTIICTVFSVFCLFITLTNYLLPEAALAYFMCGIIIVGYLNYPISKKHVKPNTMPIYDAVIMLAGAFSFFWFGLHSHEIRETSDVNLSVFLTVLGFICLLTLIELCRRSVGIPILCVAGAFVVYYVYYHLSWNVSVPHLMRMIASELAYSSKGIFGTPVNVCKKFIVLFIIFGAFLERTGISEFFISFANRIAGWSSGGPAKVAVISSALCGMVSGSSVGNTVTTGSVTIPMMKKTGYKPEFAGAVEAAASTGGQIMPPIMGAAAFLMAENMDLPYTQVAVKAILPAVLYFAGIFIAVHLEAKKLGLKGISRDMLPKWKSLIKNIYLLIPLVLLVALVSTGAKTMQTAASLSIVAAAGIGCIHFIITALEEKATDAPAGPVVAGALKKSGLTCIDALAAGGKGGVTVAVACGIAGIITGCLTSTGLANDLINGISQFTGNYAIIGLFLTMLCCIVLGMGVPTTANYCIMAATCAPILMKIGIPQVAAHFFVFYFGIVADITPPVALAAYAGSAIAKSNPMKTGVNATKLAIAAFIVPYIFAFSPEMLFVGENITVFSVILISVTALLGLFAIAAALNGHLFKKIPVVLRLVLAAGGLAMMIPGWQTDLIGLVVLAAVILFQYFTSKNGKNTPAEAISA